VLKDILRFVYKTSISLKQKIRKIINDNLLVIWEKENLEQKNNLGIIRENVNILTDCIFEMVAIYQFMSVSIRGGINAWMEIFINV